jgi:lambda family phage portal protein
MAAAAKKSVSNVVDNVVAFFNPSAGLARARARGALELIQRSFDGAKTGRRTGGWTTGGTSANAEIVPALSSLRNRSRDLRRNNPYASKAIDTLVANTIGTGITAKLSDGQALWDKWITECDADGQLDLYGIQALVDDTVEESGECFVRLRYRLPSDGLSVPLQLQVLEPDYLDNIKTETLPNGGYIQNGIEYDAIGRRAAYWMYKQHPGENAPILNSLISVRVAAADILHIYDKKRPGQARGVPRLAPVMLKMRDLDDYEEAELVRKGIESCFAAFVHTSDENSTLSPLVQTETGVTNPRRLETLGAGMINYLRPGEEVTFGAPNGVQGYNEYIKTQLHAIAAGAGVTYEQMTGDLSGVNYSSIRAGTLEFRRQIDQMRWLVFIPMFCTPLMKAWANAAYLANKIKSPNITAEWTPPRWDWVDPVKDITGELLELASGLKPWGRAVRERGYDPDANIKEIAEEQAKFKAANIDIKFKDLALGASAAAASQQQGANQ